MSLSRKLGNADIISVHMIILSEVLKKQSMIQKWHHNIAKGSGYVCSSVNLKWTFRIMKAFAFEPFLIEVLCITLVVASILWNYEQN